MSLDMIHRGCVHVTPAGFHELALALQQGVERFDDDASLEYDSSPNSSHYTFYKTEYNSAKFKIEN